MLITADMKQYLGVKLTRMAFILLFCLEGV